MFSGKVDALAEQFSYKNRRTRRAAARELCRLGYVDKGFRIEAKLQPARKQTYGSFTDSTTAL